MKAIPALHLLLAWMTAVNAAFKCSLCEDGFSPTDESQVINLRGKEMTCEAAHLEGVMTFETRYECDFLRNLGQFLCLCKEGTGPNVKLCKLCQDGSSLPNPSDDPWPGFSCAELESTATRNDVCPLYQNAFGEYCGCKKNVSTGACRLCKSGEMLRPRRVTNNGKSCLEREFLGTLSGSCAQARQSYRDRCCEAAPTRSPTRRIPRPTRTPTRRIRPPTRTPTRRIRPPTRTPTRRTRRPTRRPTRRTRRPTRRPTRQG